MGSERVSEAALDQLAEANCKKFWYKALETALLIRDVDYFKVFEQSAATRKGSVSSRGEQLRRKFVVLFRVFIIYICIKLTTIIFIQYNELKMRSCAATTKHFCTILDDSSCRLLTQVLGNPWDSIQEIAINLYGGPQFMIIPSLFVTYLFRGRHKLDCPPCRLLLDPHFELKRIDSSVRSLIDMISRAIRSYRQDQAYRYLRKNQLLLSGCKHLSDCDRRRLRLELAHWWRNEKKFCQQIVSLTCQLRAKEQLRSLRPISLRPEYFVKMSKLFDLLSILNVAIGQLVAFYILLIVLVPCVNRCRTGPICSPFQVLIWSEFVLFLEMSLLIILCGIVYGRNLETTILLIVNQLDILKELTRNLEDFHQSTQSYPALTSDMGWHRHAGICRPLEDGRHARAMQLFIKLVISDMELKRNSHSLSMEAIEQGFLLPSVLIGVVLNNWLNLKESAWLYFALLSCGVITGNLFAIVYAHVYSKTIHYERKFRPLLANLMVDNQAIYNHCERLQLTSCSFVIELLRKFLLLSCADAKRHMISPLGIGLSYEKIIQVNFFIVFVYSLTNQNM